MRSVTLRPLSSTETSLLETATLGNMNWCGDRFTVADVRQNPALSHYTRMAEERGDFGIVAEIDGEPAGVAWALYLPHTGPGYGFVNEDTPEASLWVSPTARGAGVGRTLMRALTAEGKRRGIHQMSLSVETGNFARDLYASEGFVDVAGGEADGVMLRRL